MPRLLLLNGPPGIGKSTLARRYVADHPLALCLDIDGLRRLLGGWDEQPQASGLLAREMAVAMARVHLLARYDVVIPQLLGRVEFIEQLEALAKEANASFDEVALMDTKPNALARFEARRADAGLAVHHRDAERMSGGAAGLSEMYDRLQAVLAHRPLACVVDTRFGEEAAAYQNLLLAIGERSA